MGPRSIFPIARHPGFLRLVHQGGAADGRLPVLRADPVERGVQLGLPAVFLLEQAELAAALLQVRAPHPQEPHGPPVPELVEQGQRVAVEDRAAVGRVGQGRLAGDGGEIAVTQLEVNRPGLQLVPPQPPGDLVAQAQELAAQHVRRRGCRGQTSLRG